MKTIFVKDLVPQLLEKTEVNWKKVIPATAFLLAMFFLGREAAISSLEWEIPGTTDIQERISGESMPGEPMTEVMSSHQVQGGLKGRILYENYDFLKKAENWGLGFGKSGEKPTGTATIAEMQTYNAYYMSETEDKVLYLTFDCGYENGNTEAILDALKKHNAPATFFVVGHYLESAPDLVKRMVKDGHTVGNHTYHHPDMSKISDRESFQKEVDTVREKYREITGEDMAMYYRPPQGKYSAENLRMAKELGYATFFWSLAYVDWNVEAQPTHKEAFDKLTGRVHPGAVVLLHNTSKTNGEILDELLTKWEEMGYSYRPLSDFTEGTNSLQQQNGR